jgi:hypothetical protein
MFVVCCALNSELMLFWRWLAISEWLNKVGDERTGAEIAVAVCHCAGKDRVLF